MEVQLQLVKTLLSHKPKSGSLMLSLLGLSILLLFFTVDQQNLFSASTLLSANPKQVFENHEYWRLFTSALIHSDLQHLGSNGIFFAGLGFLLHGYFGFWAFPLLSFIAGGVINYFTLLFYPSHISVVGASGIVYYMAAFWLTLYLLIERHRPMSKRLMNVFAFILVLLIPDTAKPQVSYLSHAVGFILGGISGWIFFKLRRAYLRSFEVWEERQPEPDLIDFEESEAVGS